MPPIDYGWLLSQWDTPFLGQIVSDIEPVSLGYWYWNTDPKTVSIPVSSTHRRWSM